jgi:hypothetical protein
MSDAGGELGDTPYAAGVRQYVLTWLSGPVVGDGPGDVSLAGPFETVRAALAWGKGWQARHGDNPCWQRVALVDDHPMVRLAVAPTVAP